MTDRRSPAWRLLILMIGAIALLGLVAAAACGDDDDGNGDPAATTDDGNGDGGGDGDLLADLAAFGGDYDSFTGKVTYDLTDFAGGDSGITSMSIYQKDGSSRYDISSEDGDITFISTP
ncbi:MAG: hypothetical protein IIB85_03865, partial [Chloroflexi bacterium]|nr:hypothetical protein [Chloroflexota bacterium]